MLRTALVASVALLAFGCHTTQTGEEQARYYENGSPKPIVSVIPVIDKSTHNIEWNLSDELTSTIHYRLLQKNKLYLEDHLKVNEKVKRLASSMNPFSSDLSWVKKIFNEEEFVVFMELVQHDEVPVSPKKDSAAELRMTMRIRVLDLRESTPKIAFQELIEHSHYIPRQFTRENFYQTPWGSETFSISPFGLAHTELTKEIAARIEDYILLTMQR